LLTRVWTETCKEQCENVELLPTSDFYPIEHGHVARLNVPLTNDNAGNNAHIFSNGPVFHLWNSAMKLCSRSGISNATGTTSVRGHEAPHAQESNNAQEPMLVDAIVHHFCAGKRESADVSPTEAMRTLSSSIMQAKDRYPRKHAWRNQDVSKCSDLESLAVPTTPQHATLPEETSSVNILPQAWVICFHGRQPSSDIIDPDRGSAWLVWKGAHVFSKFPPTQDFPRRNNGQTYMEPHTAYTGAGLPGSGPFILGFASDRSQGKSSSPFLFPLLPEASEHYEGIKPAGNMRQKGAALPRSYAVTVLLHMRLLSSIPSGCGKPAALPSVESAEHAIQMTFRGTTFSIMYQQQHLVLPEDLLPDRWMTLAFSLLVRPQGTHTSIVSGTRYIDGIWNKSSSGVVLPHAPTHVGAVVVPERTGEPFFPVEMDRLVIFNEELPAGDIAQLRNYYARLHKAEALANPSTPIC
jgi:hypothetical protein